MSDWLSDYTNKAFVQVPPGLWRGASVRLEYNNTNWNTITWDPMGCEFEGSIYTDKPKYTLEAGENELIIDVSMSVEIDANMDYIKGVEFNFYGDKKYITATSSNTYTVEGFKKTLSRGDSGLNDVPLKGSIRLYSEFGEYKDINVDTSITVDVKESPDPWVIAILTANPNVIEYTGSDMFIELELAYGISNIKDLNKIENVNVLITGEAGEGGEGSFIKAPALIGEHKMNVTIPGSFMTGYETRDKIYEAYVQYNLKDGTSFKDNAAAVVRVSKLPPEPTPTPGPTPTPTPIPTNNPPSVRLSAPSSVKAGELFTARANANDPDGDLLSFYWYEGVASGGTPSITDRYGHFWYNKTYANSNQEIEIFVTDDKADSSDSAVIRVLEPTVDCRMQIDGMLKVNRKITLKDISETPEHYPVTERKWSVTPITETGTTNTDIKHSGDWISLSEDIVFKKDGRYKITLFVKNSAGYEDTSVPPGP